MARFTAIWRPRTTSPPGAGRLDSAAPTSVAELKASVHETLDPDEIQRACLEAGHAWRHRVFDPVTTIWLFTLQLIHSNTACTHVVRLLPGVKGTDSGYCQARSRIPLAVFRNERGAGG